MAYEQRELSGSLFQNDKQGNDARPDYTGNILINGVKWRLAGWKKVGQSGKAFLSLKASEEQPSQGAPNNTAPQLAGDLNDDIPF